MSNEQSLETIFVRMGEAVIAATETVERLAERLDSLALQIEKQENQIQQQGYQIFALNESLKILADVYSESRVDIRQLTTVLQHLIETATTGTEET